MEDHGTIELKREGELRLEDFAHQRRDRPLLKTIETDLADTERGVSGE